jgi:hypothetical protein
MQRLFVLALVACVVGACAQQQQPSVEQVAAKQELDKAKQDLIKAECNLYKGTGVTPPECKR